MTKGEETFINSKIMNGIINRDAVFSDETETFLFPFEPNEDDSVKVRLRVGAGDADEVYVVTGDSEYPMIKESIKDIFEYYAFTFQPEKENRAYSFKIVCGGETYYYNKSGLSKEPDADGSFVINRHYKTPQWAKGAVGYQIYTDRFCNGDKTNDVENGEYDYLERKAQAVSDWSSLPENCDVANFYGGDLQGVIDKLDYLSELGIEMIYFNPLFVSPSNHKYDIQDYEHIDPHFGVIVKDSDKPEDKYTVRTASKENLEASDKLFAELVEKAHEKNIKVIIDGVFNHCGSFSKWLDKQKIYEKAGGYEKGAYGYEDSPYHDYFKWNGGEWPDNEEYESWWGHKNHPKLNYEESDSLFEFIMSIAEKWITPPYNADGWRIDVAADLGFTKEYNHKFWKEFRKRVKSANPEAVIIAEHYGDASEWLTGDEWDSVMNYDAFMEPVSWFFTGMEKHSDSFDEGKYCNGKEFERSITVNSAKMGAHALMTGMNEISNHDHSRFLTRTNRKVGRLASCGSKAADEGTNLGIMKEAVAFQFIWSGLPTLYYGDEAGVTGWTDPDNRRTYPWGKENKELIDFHKTMIALRKSNPVLKTGSYRFIYSDYGVVGVARFDDKTQISAVFNNCGEEKTISLPLWIAGADTNGEAVTLLESSENGFTTGGATYPIKDGCAEITIQPYGCIILKSE
ncbi:MAG: glycoside hydrolase family 13 protein [Clostridiales bacterium]|nr:glycoside hydrolase family 13 protein [Clostridiales bacterium]